MPIVKDGAALHPSINTRDGLFFYKNPERWSYDIPGIVHSLSNLCRFTGQCDEFYSVAEHSILVMMYMVRQGVTNKRLLRSALMHDSAEVVTGDINSPLKHMIRDIIKPIENAFLDEMDRRYDLCTRDPRIKEADTALYLLERTILMPPLDASHPEHTYIPMTEEVRKALPWFENGLMKMNPRASRDFFGTTCRLWDL